MPLSASLADVLQQLSAKGYQLADAKIAALPNESLHAADWRLDAMHRVVSDADSQHKVLVLGVSSLQRKLKLIFVEVVLPDSDFSPMVLMRRLFPTRRPSALRAQL
jgi:hypothetical protein